MNVKAITREWLEANGYGGLTNDNCGCIVGDLMPCNSECVEYCEAGYKVDGCSEECGEGCKWHIVSGKKEL